MLGTEVRDTMSRTCLIIFAMIPDPTDKQQQLINDVDALSEQIRELHAQIEQLPFSTHIDFWKRKAILQRLVDALKSEPLDIDPEVCLEEILNATQLPQFVKDRFLDRSKRDYQDACRLVSEMAKQGFTMSEISQHMNQIFAQAMSIMMDLKYQMEDD